MRIRWLVVLAVLASAVMVAPPARAANYPVTMRDDPIGGVYTPKYLPRAFLAPSGSTITWSNQEVATHTVTAYYGASFASNAVTYPGSYATTYGGGTVLYRCLYHSELDTRVSPPACTGMCGAIHDSATDTEPPTATIATTNGFVFTGAVRIDGSAGDNRAVSYVEVRIRPVVEVQPALVPVTVRADAASAMHPCIGCYGPSAMWTARASPAVRTSSPFFTLPPGQYRVEATAYDPHGLPGHAAPITIYVVQ